MFALVVKTLVTAVVVVAVSETARRSTLLGAFLASLPLTSILALTWLWLDTRDSVKVAALAQDILWLVLPSLVFFVLLPVLLRAGWHFALALAASCVATALAYAGTVALLRHLRG